MSDILIAPSLLSCDFANIEAEVKKVSEAGADWLHVDVMDGHFVNNITIGSPVVKAIKKVSKIPLDVHLMIENPEKYVEDFVKAGADYLTIHVESTHEVLETLLKIKDLGAKPGVTLRPGTDVEEVLPYLDIVDLVLVMTVEPGFGGQSFMVDQLPKIQTIQKELERIQKDIHIEVDGGVNEETAKLCIEAGANVLVAGSYVFKNDYKEAMQKLRG